MQVSFTPFLPNFAKMTLGTKYILQSIQTGPHFFHKSPFYLLLMIQTLFTFVRYLKLQKCAKFSFYYYKSLSKIARPGATSILTQIDPNLTQLTLGVMSNYSPIQKLIPQLCPNTSKLYKCSGRSFTIFSLHPRVKWV